MKQHIVQSPLASGLVQQVLATPELVAAVRALPVEMLTSLVHAVGLEDAGEIVALATSEQLLGVLDADLWQARRPGGDEAFDDARFALWLEVLLESGEAATCERLLELPEELVTLGFLRQVLVLDMDELAQEMAEMDEDDGDRVEKALDGCLSQELDQYRLVSRRHDGWDAVLASLMALDERRPADCRRLLDRLAVASRRAVDDEYGDLSEALDNAEAVAADAEADRDDRRAAAGYVSPASARGFLSLAASTPVDEVLRERQRDPVTRAYFRELGPPRPVAAASSGPLAGLLERAAVHGPAGPLLGAGGTRGARRFRDAMQSLAEHDALLYAARLSELAYLANLLLAGAHRDMRVDSLYDAVNLAIETCGAALEHLGARASLERLEADRLFRIGWWLRSRPRPNEAVELSK